MAEIQDTGSKHDGGKVRSKKASTKVDMTPMVDLGFLLITFFMFTTTFSKPNVMAMSLPAKPEKHEQIDTPEIKLHNSLVVIIGKEHHVYYHQQEEASLTVENLLETDLSKDGLRQVVLSAYQQSDKDKFTVIIKPSDDSDYRSFVDVLDEMAITKMQRWGITELKDWESKIYQEKQVLIN